LLLAFYLRLLLLAFGLGDFGSWMKGGFWCGRLWMGKRLLKGKRIAKGELLKENF
jgi:hypothetical protein